MDELKYTRIIQAVIETPWAILPQKLVVIRDLLAFRAAGGRLTEEELRERLHGEQRIAARANNRAGAMEGVAVLPLVGTIIPRADMLTESSGGVSIQRFQRNFRQAINDESISAIVLDVDSPGGQVGLVDELSSEIFRARGQKPISAVANNLAASAAYWIASAATEMVVTPSGEIGGIGVFAMHEDMSGLLEREGIKVSLIAAGKYKTDGNPFEPLSDEARAAIQGRVDEYYDMFLGAVARNRGRKRSEVRDGFGQGRVVGSREAVNLGMADRIATLEETVERMIGRRSRRSAAADMDFRRRRLRLAARPGSDETGKALHRGLLYSIQLNCDGGHHEQTVSKIASGAGRPGA